MVQGIKGMMFIVCLEIISDDVKSSTALSRTC